MYRQHLRRPHRRLYSRQAWRLRLVFWGSAFVIVMERSDDSSILLARNKPDIIPAKSK